MTTRRACAKCGKNRAAKFYRSERGRVCITCQKARTRTASRNKRIEETYGLTPEDYDLLFAAQQGRCAICGGTRKEKLSVDHRHRDGLIRGLLCRRCNGRLLTAALDKPEVLRAAADYLEQPPAVQVLGERIAPTSERPERRGRRARR